MEKSGIICFVCKAKTPITDIQNHVYKCKLSYETNKKIKLTLPEEYSLLFKTIQGGLDFGPEDMESFNEMISQQSIKNLSSTMGAKRGASPNQGGFSNTMPMERRKSPPRQPGQRPRLMTCPLCGREFGTLSLPIHMKTCRQKFELEQENLPRNMRRSADKIIDSYNKNNAMLQSTGNYSMDRMNNDAFDVFNKEALVPCEVCGRTFLPDRLIVHLRSCKKKVAK